MGASIFDVAAKKTTVWGGVVPYPGSIYIHNISTQDKTIKFKGAQENTKGVILFQYACVFGGKTAVIFVNARCDLVGVVEFLYIGDPAPFNIVCSLGVPLGTPSQKAYENTDEDQIQTVSIY